MPELGFEVHRLAKMISREHAHSRLHAYFCSVTGTHGFFIRYLYENRDHDVYQKDLEKRFSIGRSAVTSALQLMERNGLILRESVPQDARLKKIILTPAAMELHQQIEAENKAFEEKLTQGLSEEEQETFLRLIQKLQNNLEDISKKGDETP